MPTETSLNERVQPSPLPDEPAGRSHWLVLALLTVGAVAVRLLCLGCKPFWFDECYSTELALIDWRNFVHLLWWREANMSLYYLLLRGWLLFGHSPSFIRALSALFAAGTLPAIYWLARLLYDRRVALLAAALFAFNAYDVRYAQEARSYALFALLATLSSAFLIAWLRQPIRRNWRGYVLCSILAVYAHFYALLLIAVHWLAVHYLQPNLSPSEPASRKQLRRAWLTVGISALPLLIFVAKTGAGPIKWIRRPRLLDVLAFYQHLAGGVSWILLAIFAAACALAAYPAGKRLWRRNQDWITWRTQFLLLWLIFPVLLTVVLSFARPVFLARYLIFCLPALIVLAAAGLARLRQAWLLGSIWAAILLFCLQGVTFVYSRDFDDERDASGIATNFILDHTQPGDAILFHIAATRVPYEFFRSQRAGTNMASPNLQSQLGPEIIFPSHGPGLDYRDFTGKPSAESVSSAAQTHPRVWIMLMNNGAPGQPDATTTMLTDVLQGSLPRVQTWKLPRVEVRLYSK